MKKLAELTTAEFVDLLASDAPAPGGGSAAALEGALGAALTAMVCGLTTVGKSKEKYAAYQSFVIDSQKKAEDLKASDEDKAEVYKQIEADYGENAEKVKEMIDEELMTRDLVRRKAASIIYDTAVKTEPKAAEEAKAEEPAASAEEENKD